jgi:antitoxin component YwqK of YwqJK toxin-antitoxin module
MKSKLETKTDYYSNGQLRYRGSYKDDKREGLSEYWNENGQLRYRGSYKSGLKHGVQEEYELEGMQSMELGYSEDE